MKLIRLPSVAGIPPEMLVEAHGTFATATCTVCRRKYEGDELRVSSDWNAVLGESQIVPRKMLKGKKVIVVYHCGQQMVTFVCFSLAPPASRNEGRGSKVSHLYGRGQAWHSVFWGGASTPFPQVPDRLPSGRPPHHHGHLAGGKRNLLAMLLTFPPEETMLVFYYGWQQGKAKRRYTDQKVSEVLQCHNTVKFKHTAGLKLNLGQSCQPTCILI